MEVASVTIQHIEYRTFFRKLHSTIQVHFPKTAFTRGQHMCTADFGDNPNMFRNVAALLELTAGTITSHPKKIPQAFKEFFCKPHGKEGEDHVVRL